MKGSEAPPQVIFAFVLLVFQDVFSMAKFVLSPGVYAAGPCRAEVRGAEALPGVGASIVPFPSLGRHQSCCLNPMWFHGCDAEQPWEHLWLYF